MYVHFKKFCAKFFFDLHIRVWLLFRVPGSYDCEEEGKNSLETGSRRWRLCE